MANTTSPEEYQELGKRYYKFKQYDKALDSFTNAVEGSINPTVKLFDCRAATYDKLGDLNAALKDGREMIRIDKQDVKGYLRTGSILQKVGKIAKAGDIYKYGMKNVPVDKGFQYLQQLHDQVIRKLSPAKAIDPLTVLPVELVEMILSEVNFRTMVNCLRVSKGWKLYLTRCPNLWRHLDLSGARREVSRAFVRDAFIYSAYNIERATIHRFRDTQVLRNLATACKTLSSLEFLSGILMGEAIIEIAQCAQNLKKLVLHSETTAETVQEILRFRPTLHHAEFRSIIPRSSVATEWSEIFGKDHISFPNLQTLTLIYQPKQYFCWQIPQFRKECAPNLNALTVRNSHPSIRMLPTLFEMRCEELTTTDLCLEGLDGPCLCRLPGTLESLSLRLFPAVHIPRTISHNPATDALRHARTSDTTGLKSLSLSGLSELTSMFLSLLLDMLPGPGESDHVIIPLPTMLKQGLATASESTATPLSTFAIEGCTIYEFEVTSSLTPVLALLQGSPRVLTPSLVSLNVAGHRVTDYDIDIMLSSIIPSSKLRCINLSRTNVTGSGIKALIDALPELEMVTADDCAGVTSRDIAEYGKTRGVAVSLRSTATSSGRRVRYL